MKCSCGYVTHNPQAKACELCQKPFKTAPAPAAAAAPAPPKPGSKPAASSGAGAGGDDDLAALADAGAAEAAANPSAARGAARPTTTVPTLGRRAVQVKGDATAVDTALAVLALPIALPLALVPVLSKGAQIPAAGWIIQGLLLLAVPLGLMSTLGSAAPIALPIAAGVLAFSAVCGGAWLTRRGDGALGAGIIISVLLGACLVGGVTLARRGTGALAATDVVLSVAITPDGRHVVAGSADGKARVYDASGQSILRTLEGHTGSVCAVAAAGDVIVTGGNEGVVRMWALEGGPRQFEAHSGGLSCLAAASATGGVVRIVTGGIDGRVSVWSAADGSLVAALGRHARAISCVALLPGGERALSCAVDGTAIVWDVSGGGLRIRSPKTSPVTACAVARDGKRVAIGREDGAIEVWALGDDATLEGEARGPAAVRGLAFTAAGGRLVACHDDWSVRVWDARTGAELGSRLIPGNASPTSLVLGKDGLVVVGAGRAAQLLQLGELVAK